MAQAFPASLPPYCRKTSPAAEGPDPVGGGGEGGVVPAGRERLVLRRTGPRVGAEVADVGTDPVQRGQRVADPGVGEMTLAVDREAVAAEQLAGRPRLDPGQVDPADGELGQHLEQRAGVV